MFIKTTKAKNYEYIKLVESYWDNGKSKHRVLYNFGRADLIKNDKNFISIVKRLCEIAELPVDGTSADEKTELYNCSEAVLFNYGYRAYLKLWKDLGIEDALGYIPNNTKVEYPFSETVFLMAVQHLLEPRSKLSTHKHQNRYLCMEEIKLQNMYRALEKLSDWKEDIEAELFEYNYVRVGKTVDVVFYDVTTFAFESVIADELRNFGYSKACKFNEVQVVLGMIIDADGMPVGYELFEGDTFDGKTMTNALANIKERFGIHRVIIVADRGLNSKNNLNLIKEAGYGYIMSSKIKSMSKSMQAKVLEPENFTVVNDKAGTEDFRYKIIAYTNEFTDENKEYHSLEENLIISYSPRRSAKDKKDRERLVEKAKKLLENPSKINASGKRGSKKYLNKTDPKKAETWTLALEKIECDEKFDGYYGIQTSEKSMTATDIIDAYHTLWKIEESFRIMKSTLEVRPVFHWKPKRIKGHFVVCFLAFLMERRMEMLLKSNKDEVIASPQRIQESLNTMQLAAVMANEQELFIKTKTDPLSNKIFKLLKLEMPLNINTKSELTARFQLDDAVLDTQMKLF